MLTRFRVLLVIALGLIAFAAVPGGSAAAAGLGLADAVLLANANEPQNVEVGKFLQIELARRTGITLPLVTDRPSGAPVIALGRADQFPGGYTLPSGLTVPEKPEGFAIWVNAQPDAPAVYLVGRDNKGVLFAAGYLLRKMYLAKDFIQVADGFQASSAPVFSLRGQQIIQRSQNREQFIDWRDVNQVKQYIRELAIFGNNTIEPTLEAGNFRIIAEYCETLDIDFAYTVNCDVIIALNAESDEHIRNWLSDIPGIDQFVTYGGDHSGARPPYKTFPAMERVVPMVLESHPGAQWWYSNQCMGGESTSHSVDSDDYTFPYLQSKQPTWLHGLIYGPWTKRGIPDIRADLPPQYELRHYPDICHVQWCQYPVPKWDRPWAQVWSRAANIYAMPRMMRAVHNAFCEDTIGSTSYNHTGASNDMNKFVFTAMDWDPDGDLEEFMRDYARVFIAYQFEYDNPGIEAIDAAVDTVAQALFALEENWTGPLDQNDSPVESLELWREIVTLAGGPQKVPDNWRLDMYLTKALIDAQVKRKYDAEMQYEREAYAALEQAPGVGLQAAIANARAALARVDTEFQSMEDFEREMRSWGISDGYGDREVTLMRLYAPLNDRLWLEAEMNNATSLADIERIVHYEDPGPGGFYDNLGREGRQPHLVRQRTWEEDPGFVYSPFEWNDSRTTRRQSQHTHALTRYDTPLIMRWEDLDPEAEYYIEVVYLGPFNPEFRCDTDDGFEIHRPRMSTDETPERFDIPQASTRDGVLQLEWRLTNRTRGVSVAEIWLKKASN